MLETEIKQTIREPVHLGSREELCPVSINIVIVGYGHLGSRLTAYHKQDQNINIVAI